MTNSRALTVSDSVSVIGVPVHKLAPMAGAEPMARGSPPSTVK